MGKRARLNELDAEIRQLHRTMADTPLSTPIMEINQLAERLASLSAEYIEVESLSTADATTEETIT